MTRREPEPGKFAPGHYLYILWSGRMAIHRVRHDMWAEMSEKDKDRWDDMAHDLGTMTLGNNGIITGYGLYIKYNTYFGGPPADSWGLLEADDHKAWNEFSRDVAKWQQGYYAGWHQGVQGCLDDYWGGA